ncbi:hypothetical protein [Deinococcus humi]|uniref:Uncharacterized protein n=1 Tax=Deinococcus humi TaxID=662880 RepID=A0A7W8JTH6_9DEIO|nr:hypothetical protein [Deinococcus humi]MBB5362869.1 hypothetical protein [Deinococcus humi]
MIILSQGTAPGLAAFCAMPWTLAAGNQAGHGMVTFKVLGKADIQMSTMRDDVPSRA